MKSDKVLAIIPAAGSGTRFNAEMPKQFFLVGGKPLIEYTVKPFLESDLVTKICIPINKIEGIYKNLSFFNHPKVEFIEGGNSRAESVLRGLEHNKNSDFEYVYTHDSVRPNLNIKDLEKLYEEIKSSNSDLVFFYVPIRDSIKEYRKCGDTTISRDDYYLVQTPQISNRKCLEISLKKCIAEGIDIPDESAAIERNNFICTKLKGRYSNIKVTHRSDIEMLPYYDLRTGMGFDIHRLSKGSGFKLGGVRIDCNYEIVAHSDGDVLLHSIADAILGSVGLGDIGTFFPDTDEKNLNLDSTKIINFCIDEINKKKLILNNIDATIICEEPKIGPHREKIIDNLSQILKIKKNKLNIKATTTEKLGIIGKNNAIAVESIATVKSLI